MKLLVISDAPVVINDGGEKAAYAPYVKELDLWMRHVDHTTIISPDKSPKKLLGRALETQDFTHKKVGRLDFHRPSAIFKSLLSLPYKIILMIVEMKRADHIHFRSPSNLALLGGLVQVLFPGKKKSVKYAGNWDPDSEQPLAYRWQRQLFADPVWSKNLSVMAYGEWPDQSANVKKFFTATYSEKEIPEPIKKSRDAPFYAMYVGTMTKNKDPERVLNIIAQLREDGVDSELDFYGEGDLKEVIADKVKERNLQEKVRVHGNQPQEVVAAAYKRSHFSFLISQSEGWPKVVAEAMWHGCIPVATPVSCVPWMLNNQQYSNAGAARNFQSRKSRFS